VQLALDGRRAQQGVGAPRGGQPSRLLNQSGDEPDDVVELRAAEKGGGSRKSGQAEPL
jgi:hypothetical protein